MRVRKLVEAELDITMKMKVVSLEEQTPKLDVDSVVSFESFRALKFSKSENFRVLKLSLFDSFRVIKF